MPEGAFYQPQRMSRTALAVVVLMHGAAITALALARIDAPVLDKTRTRLIDIFTPKPPPPEPPKAAVETPSQPPIYVPPTVARPPDSGSTVTTTTERPREYPPLPDKPEIVLEPQPRPEPEPRRIEPARARANLASYVSDSDYPASAIRAEQQGTTRFRLSVAPNGKVADCIVTSSSGSPTLDSATCRLMKSRARFIPAKDGDGRPVSDTATSAIRWVLPDR
jgi:periplasmic protein TonB